MTRVITISLLLFAAVLASAQTVETRRPSSSTGTVVSPQNVWDNILTTYAFNDVSGDALGNAEPDNWHYADGVVQGWTNSGSTYSALVLKYKCETTAYPGFNGAGAEASVTAYWTGGSSALTCNGATNNVTLPATLNVTSLYIELHTGAQDDNSYMNADPGEAVASLYEAWLEGTVGTVQRARFRVTTTE